jgi:N-acetylglucosaminyldiphosphoundecaprenol N-acetyl-beta-D-mannosaminyltransferase
MLQEQKVLGVKVNTGLDTSQAVKYIEDSFLTDGKTHYVCTTNPEFVMDAQSDPEFKKIINESDLSLPDGSGILFALEYERRISNYLSKNKKSFLFPVYAFVIGLSMGLSGKYSGSRVSGVSLVEKICEVSSNKKYNTFFLGGERKDFFGNSVKTGDDVATLAAQNISKRYPGIRIVGSSSAFRREASDDVATCDYIRDCMKKAGIDRLDFLFVAYNHIHQEKWILRNASSLPASVSIGVGGTFDYFAGIKKLSPDILIQRNLDWLFRLITQPWRLKRIFKAFPQFPLKIFLNSIK